MNYAAIEPASLAWLLPELCNTLALTRGHLAQAKKDSDAKKSLSAAKKALHDAQGALKVIDAQGLVHYLDCVDQAISNCAAANPHLENHAHQVLDEACYALVCYLSELYNQGEKLQPVALFAYYEAVCLLDPTSEIAKQYDPSDLYYPPIQVRLNREQLRGNSSASARELPLKKLQTAYEAILLQLFKGEFSDRDGHNLASVLDALAQQSSASHAFTFWKTCQAVVLGLKGQTIAQDPALKRWLGRVNVQIKHWVGQSPMLSERLLREALYLIAQRIQSAPQTLDPLVHDPILAAFGLAQSIAQNNTQRRYGHATPVNAGDLVEKLGALKTSWDQCLPTNVQADGVSTSTQVLLRRLRSFNLLATELRSMMVDYSLSAQAAVVQGLAQISQTMSANATALSADQGLVGAKALLWVERSIAPTGATASALLKQAGELITALKFDHNTPTDKASALPTVDTTSAQSHVNAVVREAITSLSAIEKQLDDFFRYGQDAGVLSQTRPKLLQISSTLELIELRQISLAIKDVERIIAQFEQNPHVKEVAGFEKLATLFSQVTQALDLYTLSPTRALNDFIFNPYKHSLVDQRAAPSAPQDNPFQQLNTSQPSTTNAVTSVAAGAFMPSLASVSPQGAASAGNAATDLAALQTDPATAAIHHELLYAEQVIAVPAPIATPLSLEQNTILGTDDIFILFTEEAHGLLRDIESQTHEMELHADGFDLLAQIRRHFHTLKGSSRTIGLRYFGDAAWLVEQTINRVLAQQQAVSIDLIQYIRCAHQGLKSWLGEVDDVALGLDLNEPDAVESLDAQIALKHADFATVLAPYLTAIERHLSRPRPPVQPAQSSPQPSVVGAVVAPVITAELSPIVSPIVSPVTSPTISAVIAAPPALAAATLTTVEPTPPLAISPSVKADVSFELTPVLPSAHVSVLDTQEQDVPVKPIKSPIRLVKDNSGSQPQDFIDKARWAVAQAQSLSQNAVPTPTPEFTLTPVQVNPVAAVTPSTAAAVKPGQTPAPEPSDAMVSFGPLRLPKQLFAIYIQETQQHLTALRRDLNAWQSEQTLTPRPCLYEAYRHVHSLKGSAATIGFNVLSELAAPLELLYGQAHEYALLPTDAHLAELGHILSTLELCFEQFCSQQYPVAQALCGVNIKLLHTQMMATCVRATSLPSPHNLADEPAVVDPITAVANDSAVLPAVLPAVSTADLPLTAVPEVIPDVSPDLPIIAPQRMTTAVDSEGVEEKASDLLSIVDEIDWDIWNDFFAPEAHDLLPKIQSLIQQCANDTGTQAALKRDLHTLKGSARMAGALRLGAMVHALETSLETSPIGNHPDDLHTLSLAFDDIYDVYESLNSPANVKLGAGTRDRSSGVDLGDVVSDSLGTHTGTVLADASADYQALMAKTNALFDDVLAPPPNQNTVASVVLSTTPALAEIAPDVAPVIASDVASKPALTSVASEVVDTKFVSHLNPALQANATAKASDSTFAPFTSVTPIANVARLNFGSSVNSTTNSNSNSGVSTSALAAKNNTAIALPDLRIRSQTLNTLVSQAAEISSSKGRLDQHVLQLRQSLKDLTDNVARLRQQLRELEIQAESQMTARTEQSQLSPSDFDPLEFDRFTRLQELTRMLNESLSDMITLRDSVAKTLLETERELGLQSKASKALNQSLMHSRLVAFDVVSDRLYRVVRQSAKDLGKQINLDIVGGHLTLDRSILERLNGTLEHLVRNCAVHGIEALTTRDKQNKTKQGLIRVQVSQQGNELEIIVQDDGQGLPLEQIRDIAVAKNLLSIQSLPTIQQLTEFIFVPGFSTAKSVTELAGRGIGMDVVRNDILSLGGRISVNTQTGSGTQFNIRVPVTLAVNQVLMIKVQDTQHAIPASLVEIVVPVKAAVLAQAYNQGSVSYKNAYYPFANLVDLLKSPYPSSPVNQTALVVLLRSGEELLALHVDAVLGSQEVVVKPLNTAVLGAAGLSNATLLGDGTLCLILDPLRMWFAHNGLDNPQQRRFNDTSFAGSPSQQHAAHAQRPAQSAAAPSLDKGMHSQLSSRAAAHPLSGMATVQAAKMVAMVIDDSLTVRKVTQRLLEREGWEVLLAKDGLDALEQLQSARPDILLLDIEMPRMDGFDVARNVRADDKIKHIPIIMITSRIGDKHRDHAISLGVNGYMGKPFRDDELLAEMARLTKPAPADD